MFQPRWFQKESVDALFDYFDENKGVDPGTGKPKKANPLICLPTGTGKSLVIAFFIQRALQMFPQTRFIMATHVKELIEQNAAKVESIWPAAPIGIYSAGLKSKDSVSPIVFGGIKSMVGKLNDDGKPIFGFRDLLIIDEAHLVSPSADTSYVKFIMDLMHVNPYMRVIGLSATPYRMGLGYLTEGQIFTDIAYNLCTIEGFGRLIAEGYLSPIFPRPTDTKLNVEGVSISGGEFVQKQLQAAVDKADVTYGAVQEMIKFGWDKRCWIVFAAGIEHAEHIAEMMRNQGIQAAAVHSKMPRKKADEIIESFKRGELRCLVNKDMLTTGFDHPPIDLVGMMRPTFSTGLWVQMLGRATRPHPGKKGAMVLDFAGNTPRLGPINDPLVPRPRSRKNGPRDAPIKICPESLGGCGTYNHAVARHCVACDYEFPKNNDGPDIRATAGTDKLLVSDLPETEIYDVDRVIYVKHFSKRSGKWSIKVVYYCNLKTFYEYITTEDEAASYAKKKGRDWIRARLNFEPPQWKDDDIITNCEMLRTPKQIKVWTNKKPYPQILDYNF